jgi:ABC-type glycerol-3-phosphate transport system permease component
MKNKVVAKQKPSLSQGKASVSTIVIFILLLIYVLALFVPILWSILTSFVADGDYETFYFSRAFDSVSFPSPKTFENFAAAWNNLRVTSTATEVKNSTTYNILGLFNNSFLYSIGCALCFTLCPCFVAYATARFKFRFSKILYGFVIVTMSLPIVGSMPSEIQMLHTLHINGTFFSLWLLRFNFLSIYYLIFYAQFESIPQDYTEAAKIDGANNFEIMMRVILPQAWGTILTVFVLSFITYWNDFQIPLLYLPEYPTAAYCIYYFVNVPQSGNVTSQIPVQMAGTILVTLPIILVFAIFNKRLRVSVAMGGIKG